MTSERQKGFFFLFLLLFSIAGEVSFTTSGFLIYFLSRADTLLSQVKGYLCSHHTDKTSLEMIGRRTEELGPIPPRVFWLGVVRENGDSQLLELLECITTTSTKLGTVHL